jgi:transcriptional regulator GlxA family with amidase domain
MTYPMPWRGARGGRSTFARMTRRVAILLFDDVEVLDFAGPFEVFSVAGRRDGRGEPAFVVSTVAARPGPIVARNGLTIMPHFTLADCPSSDILIVPGGYGSRALLADEPLLAWVRQRSAAAELTLSVCTGALVLGAAGLLDGLQATTHQGALDELRRWAPAATIRPEARVVDNGRIILSGGISAGIDMSLHVVARLLGIDHAVETARYMEYDWRPSERVLAAPAG